MSTSGAQAFGDLDDDFVSLSINQLPLAPAGLAVHGSTDERQSNGGRHHGDRDGRRVGTVTRAGHELYYRLRRRRRTEPWSPERMWRTTLSLTWTPPATAGSGKHHYLGDIARNQVGHQCLDPACR